MQLDDIGHAPRVPRVLLIAPVLLLVAVVSAGCSEPPGPSVQPETEASTPSAPSNSVSDETNAAVVQRQDDNGAGVAGYLSGEAAAKAIRARSMVLDALERYDRIGHADTISYYNDEQGAEDEHYVFIVESSGDVVSHPDPIRRGRNLNGPLGTDLLGFKFGVTMLATDELGTWVTYAHRDALPQLPEIYRDEWDSPPQFELDLTDLSAQLGILEKPLHIKSTWVVRHDDLIFGSGWYIDDESFIESFIRASAAVLRTEGLIVVSDPTWFERPGSITADIQTTVDYYNSVDSLMGTVIGFIADGTGTVLTAPSNPELIGIDITELFGPSIISRASDAGEWMIFGEDSASSQDADSAAAGRLFVIRVDDYIVAGGWSGKS